MASLPTYLASDRTLIDSYRRAQYLVANSKVPSSPQLTGAPVDEETCCQEIDSEEELSEGNLTLCPQDYGGVFQCDPGQGTSSDAMQNPVLPPRRPSSSRPCPMSHTSEVHESTPLLRQSAAFPTVPCPGYDPMLEDHVLNHTDVTSPIQKQEPCRPSLCRSSTGSSRSIKFNYGGQSTFGQTLFNSTAMLLGIGMLSEPLAFAYAGWIGGSLLLVFYGSITCYTAKILSHMILSDPRLRTYADIGQKAFGPRSTVVTSVLFCLELFALSVVLVTLYADSLHTIAPTYSANAYKLWGLLILIPTVFLPLSLLSFTSVLGIMSTVLIIIVVLVDGFSKRDAPGSLWSPADTTLGFETTGELGIAFGLFMAGFSGHAVIPSLARDMIDPGEFDRMINWAFIIATFLYAVIGYAGYLMFGRFVSDEISIDLLKTSGYNPILNSTALWMLVVSPISKFALATRPLNITLEIMLGLESIPRSPSTEDIKPSACDPRHSLKRILTVIERVVFALLSVGVSILVPEFSSTMAFLGSFSAFVICVIGPISAKVVLAGRLEIHDAMILAVTTIMAFWGTVAAFWSS